MGVPKRKMEDARRMPFPDIVFILVMLLL
jgi:hypothetical protein